MEVAMARIPAAGVLIAGLMLAVSSVHAGTNADAKIVIHLLPTTTKMQCSNIGTPPACSGIVTSGDLFPATYQAYLLITNGDAEAGVSGAYLGLDYDGAMSSGVDILGWYKCGDGPLSVDFHPEAGSGGFIFGSCAQRFEPGGPGTGVVQVCGFCYLAAYSADTLRIVPGPLHEASVGSCDGPDYVLVGPGVDPSPSPLGTAVFSAGATVPGYNLCDIVPVEASTWGGFKAQFAR
jgi:hypothetical protein